jgi:hypothetical protein
VIDVPFPSLLVIGAYQFVKIHSTYTSLWNRENKAPNYALPFLDPLRQRGYDP